MRFSLVGAALGLLCSSALVESQTFTNCNPLEKSCPPDPAFGRSETFDFTQGPFKDFKAVGKVEYGSDGAAFTVAEQGNAPLLQSNWYIMFGRVEMVVKAAPGVGIVSSAVLQSDDLDEIDWEWLGANNNQVQTNYFGKGNTQSFSRGAFHDDFNNHDEFKTYTIEWTHKQIAWQIDGKTVRAITPDSAEENQYPQSPMMVRVGIWAGGDPNNAEGTIGWAGGKTDYSAGPYTMYLKSMSVTDYSTGSSYSYGDKSGSWQSIKSEGGQINGNSDDAPQSVQSAPSVTATVDIPVPWSGTHRETSTFDIPSVWPWVPSTLSTSVATMTSDPNSWSMSGTGQILPPSAASSFQRSPSSASSLASSSHSGHRPTETMTSIASQSTNGITAGDTGTATKQPVSSNTAHVAPTAGAANSMLEVPAAIGAFCMLVGGALAMF